jgi:hypothetical protein
MPAPAEQSCLIARAGTTIAGARVVPTGTVVGYPAM